MKKIIHWLKIAFLLQLVLATGLFFYQRSQQTQVDSSPLLSVDQQALDQLKIASQDAVVTLKKVSGQWRLPDHHDLPANQAKVDGLINRLVAFKKGWPVTTSASAHERFELTDKGFKRSIGLYQGDKILHELMIGSAPGFKQSHVRLKDDDNVYALSLNAYELPTANAQWLKKDLLTVENVTRIKGHDYAVKQLDGEWYFDDDEADKANMALINSFINNLSHFNVVDVMEHPPQMNVEDRVRFTVENGQPYTFDLLKQADNYFVKRSDIDHVFLINQAVYESLVKLTHADLVADQASD